MLNLKAQKPTLVFELNLYIQSTFKVAKRPSMKYARIRGSAVDRKSRDLPPWLKECKLGVIRILFKILLSRVEAWS